MEDFTVNRSFSIRCFNLIALYTIILMISCGESTDSTLKQLPSVGKPEVGYDFLVNENYVGCGIPVSVFEPGVSALNIYSKIGGHDSNLYPEISGRNELNKDVSFFANRTIGPDGVDMVSPNCMLCHSQAVDGKTIVGLGNITFDYTIPFLKQAMQASPILTKNKAEREQLSRFTRIGKELAPYIRTSTVISNPAMQIAAVLGAHRDPYTLEWSDEAFLPMPSKDHAPIDVPPWWRMKYRTSMFYSGEYRGVHRRPMMGSSALCIDSVKDAEALDDDFVHVEAFVKSIEPPKYPFPIDRNLAAKGKTTFEQNCSRCHGNYHEDGRVEYEEEFIRIEDINTDRALMEQQNWFWTTYKILFEGFYGELKDNVGTQQAYLAPPLVGIWATAPFLHNGSIPNIAELLEPEARPTYWLVNDQLTFTEYDREKLGWKYKPLKQGKDSTINPLKKSYIYDTTLPGYANHGHDYGKDLEKNERIAVLEYLKTL